MEIDYNWRKHGVIAIILVVILFILNALLAGAGMIYPQNNSSLVVLGALGGMVLEMVKGNFI